MTRPRPVLLALGFLFGLAAGLATCSRSCCDRSPLASFVARARAALGLPA